jgi:xylan 1,4-beta-xylosidase
MVASKETGGRRVFDPQTIRETAFGYYERLGRLERYVAEHLTEPITAARAAEVAGLETKYFSTFFRVKVGVRFKHWLGHVRTRRAIDLIRNSDQSLTVVAFEAGFADLRTFDRVFKQHTGMTPREYRRDARPC